MKFSPMRTLLEKALRDFRKALVAQGVYDEGHQNLKRAYNGAKDFVNFLVDGRKALKPRPPRSRM